MIGPRLAWGMCAVAMTFVLTGPGLLVVAWTNAEIFALAFGAAQVSTTLVGGVVASRLPRHPIGWLLLVMGGGLGLSATATAYGALGLESGYGPLPWDEIATWFGGWSLVPVFYGGVVLLLHLFPDGKFISPAWRRVAYVSMFLVLCAAISDALEPGRLEDASDIENPLAATGRLAEVVTTAQAIIDPLALPVFGAAAAALVVRFRRSHGIERQQLKWIVWALVIVGVGLGLSAGAPMFGDVTFFIALFGLAAMPVATGMAILRYRLYDIDVVIHRTLVYGALSATLAIVYVGSVLLLQLLLSPFTEGSSLAIAVSTLTVAGLFRPVRAGIQDGVDRRFFRRKYDARRTLETFGDRMRDEVDLADIGSDLLEVVSQTVQPSHASLWLRDRESAR